MLACSNVNVLSILANDTDRHISNNNNNTSTFEVSGSNATMDNNEILQDYAADYIKKLIKKVLKCLQ